MPDHTLWVDRSVTAVSMAKCEFWKCTASVSQNLVFGALNVQTNGAHYCSMHVCPVEDCSNPVGNSKGAEACTYHTCLAPDCVRCVAYHSTSACPQHACATPGCYDIVLCGRLMCAQHACLVVGCEAPVSDAFFQRCRKHMCNANGCGQPAPEGGHYCFRHACVYWDAPARDGDKVSKEKAGRVRVCQREGFEYLGKLTLCMYHTCTNGACKNVRARHYHLCHDCLRSLGAAAIVQLSEPAEREPLVASSRLGYLKITGKTTPRTSPYQLRPRKGRQ
jgi:hypothetical protein